MFVWCSLLRSTNYKEIHSFCSSWWSASLEFFFLLSFTLRIKQRKHFWLVCLFASFVCLLWTGISSTFLLICQFHFYALRPCCQHTHLEDLQERQTCPTGNVGIQRNIRILQPYQFLSTSQIRINAWKIE